MADRLKSARLDKPAGPHEQDFYEVLQVSRTASSEVIQAAYRALARGYHPDLNDGMDAGPMRLLNTAYETLSDPDRRTAYDVRTRGLRSQELRQLQTRQTLRAQPRPQVGAAVTMAASSRPVPLHALRGTPSRAVLLATMFVIILVVLSAVVGVWAVAAALDDSPATVPFEQLRGIGEVREGPAQPFLNPR